MRQGADCSNWTGAPDASWDGLADAIDALLPQAIVPPSGYPPGVTRQQIQWSLDHGKITIPYFWKWWGTTDNLKRALDEVAPFEGQIDAVAVDNEDTSIGPVTARIAPQSPRAGFAVNQHGLYVPQLSLARFNRQPAPPLRELGRFASGALEPRLEELDEAFALVGQLKTKSGLLPLNYSGGWFWGPYLGNTSRYSEAGHLNWGSLYDGIFNVAVWTPWGGWTTLAIKQPFGTSTIGGVGNLDPDVLADDFLVPPAPDTGGDTGDTGATDGGIDTGWLEKKGLVVQTAGELQTVADQLEAQARGVIDLAQGVRERASAILS